MASNEPTAPEPRARCDTTDMLHIHQMFRSTFGRFPELVAGVADHDTGRATVVAAHISEIGAMLHHHHEVEDELLWDTLEQRAPACALHIAVMRSQHAGMGQLLDDLDAMLPGWAHEARQDQREELVELLGQIRTALLLHLGQEEQRILPTASSTMSAREWAQLGRRGRSAVPRDRTFIQLGWIVDSLSQADREVWLRHNLPAPIRLVWRFHGSRRFTAHRDLVLHGPEERIERGGGVSLA
ncbi:hemerythrin domain-containing protein [Arthrobacter sp. JSM 101049]|uniref:hemerythrin domain-containing protein n=1 Tax=Arthrobacter sp. JSM 101049 TaxID=929097 RepID=UPI003565D7F4